MSTALHVFGAHIPNLRIEKVARMAASGGWRVDVVAGGGDTKWPLGTARVKPGAFVDRARRRVLRVVRPHAFDAQFPILGLVEDALQHSTYDVVHWNELRGAVTGARLAHARGAKFVLDLHENFPYNYWSTARDLGVTRRDLQLDAWLAYERKAVHVADAVFVTVEEMASRLIGMHDADPDVFVTVPNTERAEDWERLPRSDELRDRFRGRFVVLYGGSCSTHRGIDTAIKALHLLRTELPHVLLVVVGDGPAVRAWQRLAGDLRVSDLVAFEGWQAIDELRAYMREATIGIVPHHQYAQTDNTVPHKLYQNFAAGLPTLVSSCHCLERIITETGAGDVFRAGYPDSLAAALLRMADEAVRANQAAFARAAALTGPHSWPVIEQGVLASYGSPSPRTRDHRG